MPQPNMIVPLRTDPLSRSMRLPSLALAAVLLAAPPLAAAETGWQELAPDTRVRVITAGAPGPDGILRAAIELDMPQNTKTYWRVPGETGIPTRIDLAGSEGVGEHRVFWPYPEIEEKGGYTDFVYHGPTVIPFEVAVTVTTPVLNIALLMGICSDICVPATARFTLPIDPAMTDPGNDLRITQALANVPIPWDQAGDPVPAVAVDPAAQLLLVTIGDNRVDPTSILADAADLGYLLGAPQKSREDGVVRLPLIGEGDGADLVDKSVGLVFMTAAGPYEVTRTVRRSTAP
jgi:DsbC/DsbD-like thiol-disulfide interchange protein